MTTSHRRLVVPHERPTVDGRRPPPVSACMRRARHTTRVMFTTAALREYDDLRHHIAGRYEHTRREAGSQSQESPAYRRPSGCRSCYDQNHVRTPCGWRFGITAECASPT